MDAVIIVGANYGDEGKGLVSDFMTNTYIEKGYNVLNILHNGGAQRAHTVELPNGTRFVFHHTGAGSLAGADTYLTGQFIVNPMVLKEELEALAALNCKPKVFIDDTLRVTTPFDMMANQILEEARDFDKRLGTCGMGIWESIVRNNHIRLTVQDLMIAMNHEASFDDIMRKTLYRIREYYKGWRLKDTKIPEEWMKLIDDNNIIEHFIQDLYWMMMDEQMYYTPSLFLNTPQKVWAPYKNYDVVIFEGGQGLLLDGNIKEGSEYTTPSNTTTYNPAKTLSKWGRQTGTEVDNCHIIYVTRTYMTRHGRGELYDEQDVSYIEKGVRIFDKTNVPNPWQGALRYAPIANSWYPDHTLTNNFEDRIEEDHKKEIWTTKYINRFGTYLFITHADEIDIPSCLLTVVPHGTATVPCKSGFYVSRGPTRNDVKYYKKVEDLR